jgi:hypothetical protein
MDISANEIMVCSGCNNIYKYYDYLQHLESNTCNLFNSTMANNIHDMEYAEYADDDGDGDDEYEENVDELEAMYTNNTREYTIARNELHLDLYNPLINNGLYNNVNNVNNNTNIDNYNVDNYNVDNHNNFTMLFENFNLKTGLDNIKYYGILYNINTPTQCPICIDLFPINFEFYNMVCMHHFCFKCAEKWFSQSEKCPLCNQNLKLFVSG